jgi:hypothetical protein
VGALPHGRHPRLIKRHLDHGHRHVREGFLGVRDLRRQGGDRLWADGDGDGGYGCG